MVRALYKEADRDLPKNLTVAIANWRKTIPDKPFPKLDAPPATFPSFARYGQNVIVTWDDADRATDPYLHAAILLSLGLVTRGQQVGDQGDIDALRDIEGRIEQELTRLQNFETSQQGEGVEVGPQELAGMMLELQARGCHNINFVIPEHVVPQILEALPYAIERGLRLPIVYNTSAYDSLHSIRLMEGVADIYMPDFKLWDAERARRYLLAPDYPEAARQVIRAMHEQVGELRVNEDGLAVRGLLVRHLVMPGLLEDTRAIMRWVAELSSDTYVNVMDQYYPAWKAKTDEKYREINRGVEAAEMERAYGCAREVGLWRFDRRWRSSVDRLWARLAGE